MPETLERSVFLSSPRYLREATAMVTAAGWAVTAIRRSDDPADLLAKATARFALIDARGALVAGLGTVRDLAGPIERRRGALLVLLSNSDADASAAVYSAGATAVLTSPFSPVQLAQALRFAARAVARLDDAAQGVVADDDAPRRRDPLTGLASVAHARSWVELLLAAPLVSEPAVIVLMVAIGRFGQLNAAYGRVVADQLLQDVAARLRTVIEVLPGSGGMAEPRLLARLAGAEFALVLAAPATLTDAQCIAQSVAEAFSAPFSRDGHLIHLGCRIGIAAADSALRDQAGAVDTLFRHAATALVSARAREPGSVEVFQASGGGDPLQRMAALESDLQRPGSGDELMIVFQPQVELRSGRIVGVEALVRWQHPVLGVLPAATLLEVAESAELATQIGSEIRDRALGISAQGGALLRGIRLSVNVTAADLVAPDFTARLLGSIAASGFDPARLTVEVTEGDLIANLERASDLLTDLRARGIRVALDDFGTGYSSLAYLRQLPLDYIKIDKSLIADLGGSGRDRIVVRGIIDMARALGICVIAEGVESAEQLAAVRIVGCDWYQGYYCSAPLNAPQLLDFVRNWPGGAARESHAQR